MAISFLFSLFVWCVILVCKLWRCIVFTMPNRVSSQMFNEKFIFLIDLLHDSCKKCIEYKQYAFIVCLVMRYGYYFISVVHVVCLVFFFVFRLIVILMVRLCKNTDEGNMRMRAPNWKIIRRYIHYDRRRELVNDIIIFVQFKSRSTDTHFTQRFSSQATEHTIPRNELEILYSLQ